jgi:HEAT repeat protein
MEALLKIAAGFDQRPMIASGEMRSLLEKDPARFAKNALILVRTDDHSTGSQNALTLLVTNDLIIDSLCDPRALLQQDANRIAKRISETIDKFLDVKLARTLLSANGKPPAVIDRAAVDRVLEILSHISDGSHIMTLLTQLLQHSDERVRSKVALLIGRINRNLQWVEQRMGEADPRVRANAIESLWGMESPEAQRIFQMAMCDKNNRVAGNGALALYRCGNLSSIEALIGMLNRDDCTFRSTAAWAMSETGDPRFLPFLTPLITSSDPIVRRNIFKAVSKIRERMKRLGEIDNLKVVIVGAVTNGNKRRLTIAATDRAVRPVQNLKPTDFVVADTGQVINNFSVEESRPNDHLSAGIAVQRGMDQEHTSAIHDAMRVILRHKSKLDPWGVIRYLDQPAPKAIEFSLKSAMLAHGSGGASETAVLEEEAVTESVNIHFSRDPQSLLEICESAGTRDSAAPDLASAVAQLISAIVSQAGSRHIFFFAGAQVNDDAWASLGRTAREGRITLNGFLIGAQPGKAMEQACIRSGGSCTAVQSLSALADACERSAMQMCANYTLSYDLPPGSTGPIKLQIFSDYGFGEHPRS